MQLIKKIIIAIIIGLIAYEATKVLLDDGFQIPATTPEISLLIIFIVTALAGLLSAQIKGRTNATGAQSSRRQSSTSSTSGSGRESGTVKWFNVRKGYGFITRDQGEDIFVHFRNIEGKGRRAISEGERVSFVVTEGDKGLQADNVSPE